MASEVCGKLGDLRRTTWLALSPADEPATAFQAEMEAVAGISIASVVSEPQSDARWSDMRDAVLAALAPLKLPRDSVVMVGQGQSQDDWAGAARLAGFIPGTDFFAERA